MTLKHTIVGAIVAILTAALFFCSGMRYAVTHMKLSASSERENTVLVTLNDQVYVHGLDTQH